MQVINKVAIAAGAAVANLLAGSAFEFVASDALVEIAILGSVTGLLASVSSGNDILLENDSYVGVVTAAGRLPVYPDDYAIVDEALAGDRLRLAVRNPSAGAIDCVYAVRITPA